MTAVVYVQLELKQLLEAESFLIEEADDLIFGFAVNTLT